MTMLSMKDSTAGSIADGHHPTGPALPERAILAG